MYEGDNINQPKINIGTNTSEDLPSQKSRRYNLQLVPDDFLISHHCQTPLCNVIESLEKDIGSKQELNGLYEKVCDLMITEMRQVIPFKTVILDK